LFFHTHIEKNGEPVDYYGGQIWLYDGLMQTFLFRGYEYQDIWERYIEYFDNYDDLPPLELNWIEVKISSDGSRLMLFNFPGFEGEILELVRK